MKSDKIYNKGQARIFDNTKLESLTKTHPLVIFAIYIPVILLMLFYSKKVLNFNTVNILVLFCCGLFTWSLFEYLAHRFAFHYHAETEFEKQIVYVMHGNHHQYPRDKHRLFMPPVPSLIISGMLFLVSYFISTIFTTNGNAAFAFFPGFIVGYLLYGSMHYAIHAWAPPFKWMKPLWRNHHLHHYKDEDHGFGVSSTLWDHLLGTMFDLKKEKEDKLKTAELIYERKKSKSLS